jgi:hypothetical protein
MKCFKCELLKLRDDNFLHPSKLTVGNGNLKTGFPSWYFVTVSSNLLKLPPSIKLTHKYIYKMLMFSLTKGFQSIQNYYPCSLTASFITVLLELNVTIAVNAVSMPSGTSVTSYHQLSAGQCRCQIIYGWWSEIYGDSQLEANVHGVAIKFLAWFYFETSRGHATWS